MIHIPSEEEIKCDKCGEILAKLKVEEESTSIISVSECAHYKWSRFSKHCWELLISGYCEHSCELGLAPWRCHDILKKQKRIINEGNTIWVLVPIT